MRVHHLTPILNVGDVPASLSWFEGLGWQRRFTWNEGGMIAGAADGDGHGPASFAAVGSGIAEIFLCKDGQGSRGGATSAAELAALGPGVSPSDNTPGVWMSWWVESPADVDAAHALALKLGVTVLCPPTDEPWGCRECRIMHPDGHTFRVASGLGR